MGRFGLGRGRPRGLLVLGALLAVAAATSVTVGADLFGAPADQAPTAAPSLAAAVSPPTVEAPSTPGPSPSQEPTPIPTPSQLPKLSQQEVPRTLLGSTPIPEWSLHVPILTYHVIAPWSVASAYSEPGLDVDPTAFDAQLALLKGNGWHSITVDRLYRDLAAKKPPPHKTFVITIDDGHNDGYTFALPILRRYGFVATYYVVAGRIGDVDSLTWAEVAALKAAGMEIGNHTMDHLHLTWLSAAQVAYEIDAAQQLLTEHLGTAPTTFAYPYWSYDSLVVRAVRAAGLRMAVTKGPVPYESWSGRFVVPRFEVYSSFSAADVLAKIAAYA